MPPRMSTNGMESNDSPSAAKQRRMDVLVPDRNEGIDCQIIAQQKRNDGMPVIHSVQGVTPPALSPTGNRNDQPIHLTDAITLSVRQPDNTPAQVNAMVQQQQQQPQQQPKASNTSVVANALAARGITVTTSGKSKPPEQLINSGHQSPQLKKPQSPSLSTLNLNSAISILPASSNVQQRKPEFAIPHGQTNKPMVNQVERPPRPPTVDLTQDVVPIVMPHVPPGRARHMQQAPRMLQSLTCQVCNKRFQSQELLMQHMASHRQVSKLVHRCHLCNAQYPTSSALLMHRKIYHKELHEQPTMVAPSNGNVELAIPVIDLKSPHTLSRLHSLGVKSYIPLSQLSAQTGGYFGLPIITIDGARNSNATNLAALGATSILSLGPLKHLNSR